MNQATERSAQPVGALARTDRLYSKLENFANFLGGLVVFGLMLFVCSEVVARTFLNKSIFGFIDLVELSMAAVAFMGAAYCQRLGGHIRMDLAVGQLKGRWLWSAEATSTFVALIVIAILVKGSWAHFMRAWEIGDTTIDAEYVTWPSKILAPLGLSLLWLRLLLNFFGYIRLWRRPDADLVGIPPPPGGHHIPADTELPKL